jgi:hypothetical protein
MMSRGVDVLVQRLGYVDFLSATMSNVPSRLPFQDGAQIGATLMHVLQPRLFFPDKPPLESDYELVRKYVGGRFAIAESSSEGTSISLGYLAELYIDFGPLGALVGMFILGLVFGRSYRFVCSATSLPTIVTFGLGVMLAMSMIQFEEGLAKLVGGFLTTLIVILVLRRLLPTLMSLLSQSKILPRRIPL